jgi:hypothetical protein
MINIHTERLISLRDAIKLLPPGRGGRPIHVASMYRWVSRGVRQIRLESVRIGGTVYTSREALERFTIRLTAIAAVPDASPSPSSPSSPSSMGRPADSVNEGLAEFGL